MKKEVKSVKLYGYKRPDGLFGIRNYLLIIPTVICANEVARRIANNIPGAKVIPHQHGCAQLEPDAAQTFRTLAGFGLNPNVGGAVVVGLGCETVQAEELAEKIKSSGKPVHYLVIQESGGFVSSVEKGTELGKEIYKQIKDLQREEMKFEDLMIGLECGGSDTTSGISANPALGAASDLFFKEGATTVLSETTELIGAEHILERRAINEEVALKLDEIVKRMEKRVLDMGVSITGANPSPGNIRGGLTTIEEKSLGCIYKAGTSIVKEVVEYAERPKQKGLVIMDTPGNDIESISGMIAGGCQLCIFTTGLGTPTGSPIAPVIKVCGNDENYKKVSDFIDINAGLIINGSKTVEEIAGMIYNMAVEVINGKQTKCEILGVEEFSINRIGPTL